MFRAGVEEALSVTIFNAVEETHVQVQLSVKGETVAYSHGMVLGEDPPSTHTQANIGAHTTISYTESARTLIGEHTA